MLNVLLSYSFYKKQKHENTITSTEPSSRTPNPDLDDITTLEAYLLLASGLLIILLLCTIFICYRKMWVLLTIFILSLSYQVSMSWLSDFLLSECILFLSGKSKVNRFKHMQVLIYQLYFLWTYLTNFFLF